MNAPANTLLTDRHRRDTWIVLSLVILGALLYGFTVFQSDYFPLMKRGENGRAAIQMLDEMRRPLLELKRAQLRLLQSGGEASAVSGIESAIRDGRQKLSEYLELASYNEEVRKMVVPLQASYEAWVSFELELVRRRALIAASPDKWAGHGELDTLVHRNSSAFLAVMNVLGDGEKPLHHDFHAGEVAVQGLLVSSLTFVAYLIAMALWWMLLERAKLRESEVRHRTLFESSQDAMMTLAPPSWTYTSGNPAMLRMFSVRDEAEFVALGPWQLSPETQPDGRPSAEKAGEMIDTAMREGSRFFEWTHRRLGGESFPATVLLTRVALGGRTFLQATVRDITAQKQAEAALRQSSERLEFLLRATPAIIYSARAQGDFGASFISANVRQQLGYDPDEFIADPGFWASHIHEDDRERIFAGLALLEKEGPHSREYRFRHKDGSWRWMRDELRLIRDATGAPIETVGYWIDVTVRKEAELALERTQAGLRKALLAKSEFMNNVTHELRTPLNSVIGFAEMLKDEVPGPLNAKQAAFAVDILASGRHLLALVEGILEMSRLDASAAALVREPVEISAALEERVAAQRKAAAARGIEIRLEAAPDAGRAELDPKALRRMLDALLDNAVKFNNDGGTVTVRVRRAGDTLEIAVSDTGIGIAREDLAKLFKPLSQLDAGLARRHGGIGLGLALAQRLAELHGGTIEVASEPGKGSTFTLRFPIEEKS